MVVLTYNSQVKLEGMSTNWFMRADCANRSQTLKAFYQGVMDDFFEKLFREYKHKKSSNIDEDKIYEFQGRVHHYLKAEGLLFQSCIRMKEGSSRLDEIIQEENINKAQLKIQHQDEKDQYISVVPKHHSSEKIERREEDHVEEEFEDDLADYPDLEEPPKGTVERIKSEIQVKREEENVEYMGRSEVKIEDGDSDSVEEQTILTIEECEKNLNCIVLGTFNANTLKHKPKQEKTSVNLDNVFIKYPSGQAFYGQLSMESNKMEKDKIRLELEKDRQSFRIKKFEG